MKPLDKVPAWRGNAIQRVIDSMRFLNLHDFMSDGERRSVDLRFKKWLAKNGVELVPLGTAAAAGKKRRGTVEGPSGLGDKL